MLVTVLRIVGGLILIGGTSLGIVIGLAPLVTGYGIANAASPSILPAELLVQAFALIGFVIAVASLTIGLDFLTRAAMLQSSVNIEAQLKQVEDLLKRRPNA